jgi:aerobic-type carbon monoxide dehydrogenase small subunit (CoxS/CutS family)
VKDMHHVDVRVNGRHHELVVEARRTLADMLRHDLGYTGTHLGCEHGICGACTVILDDQARELIASNLCRCTGYQGIVEAVLAVTRARRARAGDAT